MIILPPEEKKTSPVLKWIFRILLLFVVFLGLALFALNILSGTSDAHKRGLERAFSDIFRTPVTIGQLKTFNIFPKFTIEMEDVRGNYGADGGEVRAERVLMVFRFFDILFGRDLIENFQILNLTLTPDIVGNQGITINMAGIAPATADHPPIFVLAGKHGDVPIVGSLQLQQVAGIQPVYRIADDMPANFKFGKLAVDGKFSQTGAGEPSIHDASFLLNDKVFANGRFTLKTAQQAIGAEIEMETPNSQFVFTHMPGQHKQVWDFEQLDLSDVIGSEAIWSQILAVLSEFSPAVTPAEQNEQTQVSINIKSLTGAVTARDLKGYFISTPTQFTGWWDGMLTTKSAQSSSLPGEGAVQCGFLSLRPVDKIWSTKDALVRLDPVTFKASVKVNPETGEIGTSVDHIEKGKPSVLNVDLSIFKELQSALSIPADHPCLLSLEQAPTP